MPDTIKITSTIVLFEECINQLSETVNSFLKIPLSKKLYLIDNSSTDKYRDVFNNQEIEYIFINKNIGFGAAHNKVINKIKSHSNYHLILNPDVKFGPNVVPNLVEQLEKNTDVAMIAPRVLFPNGKHQYSCRRYPSMFELIIRRTPFSRLFFNSILKKGKYLDKDLKLPFYAEYLTGCFQLFKTEDFVKINGFDERYFLYMEDVDICRKIDAIRKKKLYYPKEQITHILKKESSKNLKMFFIHLLSSIKYFYKWNFK